MNDQTTYAIHRWMALCGPLMVVTYLYFFLVLGHNFPPPSVTLSGARLVSDFYVKYRSDILLGQSLSAACGLLYLPWVCLLTVQMWHREKVPLLSLMQLTGGTLTAWIVVMCPALWAWCAKYSTDASISADLIRTIHTLSWYLYDMTYMITTVQLFGCGMFALLDKKTPVFVPRWTGWLAIATGIGFVPLSFLPYNDTGPFALNGEWSFYLVFIAWGAWFCSFTYYMFQDLRRMRAAASIPSIGVSVGQVSMR